jgi:hypothetical protein
MRTFWTMTNMSTCECPGLSEGLLRFVVDERPADDGFASLARRMPDRPFVTPAFVRARERAEGVSAVLLTLFRGLEPVAQCPAFLRSGRWSRGLEIESLPDLDTGSDVFWNGLARYGKQRGIGRLEVNTYGSRVAVIPALGHELERHQRTEFHIMLGPAGTGGEKTRQKANLRKARRAGLVARSTRDPGALPTHIALIGESLVRRRLRGEAVPSIDEHCVASFAPYLDTGASELFQAWKGDTVVSSLLVLLAERGAYYQSSGSDADGFDTGAASFLHASTVEVLRGRGVERLNLGGCQVAETGLREFKTRLGGVPVSLESAAFDLRPTWQRTLHTTLESIRAALRRPPR